MLVPRTYFFFDGFSFSFSGGPRTPPLRTYESGIQKLSMRGCKQATITNTAFIHLRGVQTLIMAGCKQATITVAAFLRLRGIQKVNMVGCNQAIPSQMRPSCICAGSALSTPMCAPPPWRLQPLVSSPCCLSPTGRTTRACWLLLQSRSDGSFASEQKRRIAHVQNLFAVRVSKIK